MGPTWAKIPILDPHGSNLGIMPGFCPYGTHMPMRPGERLCHLPRRNTKRARLAAFDKIRNAFSLMYAQIIA